MADLKDIAQRYGEPALAMGSQMAGMAGGGLAALYAMMADDASVADANQIIQDATQRATYQPRSQAGQESMQQLAEFGEKLQPAAQILQDYNLETLAQGDPVKATALHMIPEMLGARVGGTAIKPVTKAINQPTKFNPAALTGKDVADQIEKYFVEPYSPKFGAGIKEAVQGQETLAMKPKEQKFYQNVPQKFDALTKQFEGEINPDTGYFYNKAESKQLAAQAIYMDSKMYEGTDGIWRKYYSEKDSFIKDGWFKDKQKWLKKGTYKVSDILDHKDLFRDLPSAGEVKVVFTNKPKSKYQAAFGVRVGKDGRFLTQPTIEINLGHGSLTKMQIKGILLHELTHWDDARVMGGAGGSPGYIEKMRDQAKKVDRQLKTSTKQLEIWHERLEDAVKFNDPPENIDVIKGRIEYHRERKARAEKKMELISYLEQKNIETGSDSYTYQHLLGGEVRAYDIENMGMMRPETLEEAEMFVPKSGKYSRKYGDREPTIEIPLAQRQHGDLADLLDNWTEYSLPEDPKVRKVAIQLIRSESPEKVVRKVLEKYNVPKQDTMLSILMRKGEVSKKALEHAQRRAETMADEWQMKVDESIKFAEETKGSLVAEYAKSSLENNKKHLKDMEARLQALEEINEIYAD